MKTSTRYLGVLAPAVLALASACGGSKGVTQPATQAQTQPAVTAPESDLDRVLAVDSRIRIGKLDNGLTYYVLEHQKPEKRAQLWLGVNVGSVVEDDDQRGLAHFVEHMAFNGTAKYEKMAIVDYLESIGMKFGPDVNAYTSFDETVYMLQVPTDDEAIVDKGLDILHQWAGSVSLDAAEIDKERGVVLEEWRLGRGAHKRVFDKQLPVLFAGSRYAERLPIGQREIIEKAPPAVLERFYRDWYRPDLMAVVAVGDFDADQMEAKIRAQFGDLTAPDSPRPRTQFEISTTGEAKVSVVTDPEMPTSSVTIYDTMPHRSERTVGDYRRLIADQLYQTMFNARLDEIRQRPDAPFVFAGSSTSSFVRAADSFSRFALAKEGKVLEALDILAEETARIDRHGFTRGELERAKREILRSYQQSVKERDKRDGRQFASEVLRHFFEGETMPGIEAELALVERFLPTFTLRELNSLARTWTASARRTVLVSGPSTMKAPAEAEVLALLGSVDQRTIAPYQDQVSDRPLMAATPKPGTVTKTRVIEELGVTEWTLSNGAVVVLKPTDFQNDEVRLSAFSPGGHSLVADVQYPSARFADEIVWNAGVGEFDSVALRKALAGKVASVDTYISELEEGLRGHASPTDLEVMMQLIHLSMTAPRRDETAFAAWKARKLELVRNRRLSPERSFFEDMSAFRAQNHLRRRPVTPEMLDQVDLDQAISIYQERFADAGDFTFVFVGNLDLNAIKPLVEKYLASLPAKQREETWKDPKVRMPRGVKRMDLSQGIEPKSFVYLTFHGDAKWSRDAENDMKMLTEVLRIRLREVLREDMGGVYGASTWGAIARRPRPEYSFTVFFGCSPENVTRLRKAVFDEIRAIQKSGIGDDYIAKVKSSRIRQREIDLRDNEFWTRELVDGYRFGDDPTMILDFDPMVEKVSSARVQAAAKRFLRRKQYVLGVLRPDKTKTAAKPEASTN